ncbi:MULTISPECIES: antitoxin [unclassified Streptomyces]|uniref:FitA-like ribbon-helix-helix domain-containing protein n=1 Tax=unclassified Streptomyces TaxID=2593676 RepID=UPI001BE8B559|nr:MULTISPECIES: antitoxin [unclassified Streptomyces]MBT2406784.1 antitoxin [Streptomyces sp. ISL-21]MBT2456640.1 antitoxin [Streptomyces sp. ISL-86]MBT2612208.1 antitoxin [Streptomyces sp. ISL-87]
MATLYVRDLSEEALAELKIRAARNRQSLQAYARALLEQEAATPSIDDVVARIRARVSARLATDEVLADIEAGRRRE